MSFEEIETEAPNLDPASRARLANRLLESLEQLSPAETERLWIEETARRDADSDANAGGARSAGDVLRTARTKLR